MNALSLLRSAGFLPCWLVVLAAIVLTIAMLPTFLGDVVISLPSETVAMASSLAVTDLSPAMASVRCILPTLVATGHVDPTRLLDRNGRPLQGAALRSRVLRETRIVAASGGGERRTTGRDRSTLYLGRSLKVPR